MSAGQTLGGDPDQTGELYGNVVYQSWRKACGRRFEAGRRPVPRRYAGTRGARGVVEFCDTVGAQRVPARALRSRFSSFAEHAGPSSSTTTRARSVAIL